MNHSMGQKSKTDGNEQATRKLLRQNMSAARKALSEALSSRTKAWLETLTREFGFSMKCGDLQIINSHWYVTHTGLIGLARRKRCSGIHAEAVDSLCDSAANRFVLKATVFPSKSSSGFVGYGDADPSNVSSLVRGAEMRVAETRAVNRALRKAYGIGICSVEEIGSLAEPPQSSRETRKTHRNLATATTAARRFETASVNSSGNTSSIPNSSRPMRSTSAARRCSEMPPANRLRTSSSNWPTGPRKTAMQ